MNKILFSILCLFYLSACTTVKPGERGVSVVLGKASDQVSDSGMYLWIPFIKSMKSINVKVLKTETTTEAASKDMQKITTVIALNWHIDPLAVSRLFQTVGDEDDVVVQIINPAVSEVLKAATAKMAAEEILTKRIELKNNIDESLKIRLKIYNVLVDDVSLVNLNFTHEFNQAVEAKQIAEQRSKQAEYEAQRAIIDARAAVNAAKGGAESALIKAESEAKANKLKLQTLTPELIQYEAVNRWDGKLPTMTGSSAIPFINVNKMGEK